MNKKMDIDELLKPKIGETWFVKNSSSSSVMTRKITDITNFTVELCGFGELSSPTRYETKDIAFIEKKND